MCMRCACGEYGHVGVSNRLLISTMPTLDGGWGSRYDGLNTMSMQLYWTHNVMPEQYSANTVFCDACILRMLRDQIIEFDYIYADEIQHSMRARSEGKEKESVTVELGCDVKYTQTIYAVPESCPMLEILQQLVADYYAKQITADLESDSRLISGLISSREEARKQLKKEYFEVSRFNPIFEGLHDVEYKPLLDPQMRRDRIKDLADQETKIQECVASSAPPYF